MKGLAKITNYQKVLLIVGLSIFVAGFFMINKVFKEDPSLSYSLISVSFLWLVLIFMTIITDSNEAIKEELRELIQTQVKEVRLMQDISRQEMQELKLLMGKNGKRK